MRGIVNYARHRTKNMRIIRLSYMNTTAIAIYLSSQKHLRQRSNLVHKKNKQLVFILTMNTYKVKMFLIKLTKYFVQ